MNTSVVKVNDLTIFLPGQGVAHITVNGESDLLKRLLQTFELYNTGSAYVIRWTAKERFTCLNFLDTQEEFPELKQLRSSLAKVAENEPFIIATGKIEDTQIIFKNFLLLKQLQEDRDSLTLPPSSIIDQIIEVYNVKTFDQVRPIKIGERRKSYRRCRFCDSRAGEMNSRGEVVSFKSKAHAFSEALGNKFIVCAEECDDCNATFGAGIENSFLAPHRFIRSLHGLEGKNGIENIKGKNFSLNQTDGLHLSYDGELLPENLKTFKTSLDLIQDKSYIPQDFYRCLCKFVISVIDSSEICKYNKTISWINRDFDEEHLPPITIVQDAAFYRAKPLLMCFTRKINEACYPELVGEFHYADLVYLFIVPFGIKDQLDFTSTNQYHLFLDLMTSTRNNFAWTLSDFSRVLPVNIDIRFRLKDEHL